MMEAVAEAEIHRGMTKSILPGFAISVGLVGAAIRVDDIGG